MLVTATNQTNVPFALVNSSGHNVHFGVGVAVTDTFVGDQLELLKFFESAGAVTPLVDNVAPENTEIPVITGTAQVGVELSASSGTWTGNPAPTLTYQWFADNDAIEGATETTYTPVEADVGKVIAVYVTGTNAAGTDVGMSEDTDAVIAAA